MASTALLRAHRVLNDARLADAGKLERAPSALNEVWFAGPYVLRLSASPVSRRLHYEAEIARRLPPEVGYPEIVDIGRTETGTEWLVVRRVPGVVLSRAWNEITEADQRRAIHGLAAALATIHRLPSPETDGILPPFLGDDSLECPHQLPLTRVLALIERARGLRYVDDALLRATGELVRATADALRDERPPGLVHGDMHLENVLWDGERIAVLDFELARGGPREIDLETLLRFCAHPQLHVADDYQQSVREEDFRPVPGWLRESYPDLFTHPRLLERLTLIALAFDVRALLVRPPRDAAEARSNHHALNRIRRLVDGSSYLHAWLW